MIARRGEEEGMKIIRLIIEDIKRDPVANLIIPVTTALVTSLLLCLLQAIK